MTCSASSSCVLLVTPRCLGSSAIFFVCAWCRGQVEQRRFGFRHHVDRNILIQTDKLNQNLKSSLSHGEFASNMCREIFCQANTKFLTIANSVISHLKYVSICIFLLPPPPSTRMPLLSHAGLSKQDYGWKDYYRLSSTGRHGPSFPARGACGS